MASHNNNSYNNKSNVTLLFFTVMFLQMTPSTTLISASTEEINTFACLQKIDSCKALLYQHNGFQPNQISTLYSVDESQIQPITYVTSRQDYLITVNCSCQAIDGVKGYFYNVTYKPEIGDSLHEVSNNNFSGQVWDKISNTSLYAGVNKTLNLLCACVADDDLQVMVTYTIQPKDTISSIAQLLSADVTEIENSNKYLGSNPSYVEAGWLLYVPMYKNGVPLPKTADQSDPRKGEKKGHKWIIPIAVLSCVTLLSLLTLGLILAMKKNKGHSEEDSKVYTRNLSKNKTQSLQKLYHHKESVEEITVFESEKPTLYSIEEIEEATGGFDESRIIGQGGYGSVYYGSIDQKEVAIKKMRSNKSKEFLAEIKVLCKIHHINVVELMGYASGHDDLYLVYEYIPNGSLSDHLHDPLLKGHQPLSWNARTQIALDAARGIEYIHDHTKSRYVHRDIKTTNILLDEGLRAKVADFGLAKLVGRTNDDELIATRLVGTPGYLPPESVKELQVTTKTDVFAFGVVLAELITGQRALMRDSKEPNKMRSLITVFYKIFDEEENSMSALGSVVDGNLKGNYPAEDVYKMAEVAQWCLSEDAIDRPEMQEVVVALTRIRISSTEWEASLGGSSQIFSGVFNGR